MGSCWLGAGKARLSILRTTWKRPVHNLGFRATVEKRCVAIAGPTEQIFPLTIFREMLCGCQRCSGSSVVVGVLGEPHLLNFIYENNSLYNGLLYIWDLSIVDFSILPVQGIPCI